MSTNFFISSRLSFARKLFADSMTALACRSGTLLFRAYSLTGGAAVAPFRWNNCTNTIADKKNFTDQPFKKINKISFHVRRYQSNSKLEQLHMLINQQRIPIRIYHHEKGRPDR